LYSEKGVYLIWEKRTNLNAHGMRNEIVASKQKNEEYVPLTCRWDDGKRGRKQENEQRIINHEWLKA
jgi:hypothetical protein